jgi:Icc-related predicted phosphoesterase
MTTLRFVCISDTHSLHRKIVVPDGDVLVHAGDITRQGEVDTVYDFSMWLAELPHAHKVVIPGNHDFCFDIRHPRYDEIARPILDKRRPNIHFLLDMARTIAGLRFYGSPWVANLSGWAFYDHGLDLFEHAPKDIDVLVTHAPPWLVMDREEKRGEHCGSGPVRRYAARCPRLKLHVFGHVHEGHGCTPVGVSPALVNACSLNRAYAPVNAPIVMDVDVR